MTSAPVGAVRLLCGDAAFLLSGIGLQEKVNGHTYFLHDGRARNLTEAIMWHGSPDSDARWTIEKFRELNKDERDAIVKFIDSI